MVDETEFKPVWTCLECGRQYPTSEELKEHLHDIHRIIRADEEE